MKMYFVGLRKKLDVPLKNITQKIKNGRIFDVGKIMYNGKMREAWKVVGMVKNKK